MIRRLSSIAITVCAVAFARQASAQMQTAPMTSPPPSGGFATDEGVDRAGGIVGGLLGFGTGGLGFALGAEGGYTLPMHLYIGGMFNYFLGSAGLSVYELEAQVGYDLGVIKAAPVLIRPYLGVGYAGYNVGGGTTCVGTTCVSSSGVGGGTGVISPGVLGAYFFTPHWYAGVDLRFDIATAGYANTAVFDAFATGGYKF